MSRVIKFRAWDKETNTMIYSDKNNKKDYQVEYDFTFNENGQAVCWWNEDYDDSFGYSKSNSGYLDNVMQYTGLKDKNDKEIYEGDIARVYGGEYCQGYYEYDSKCIVKWQSCGFDMVTIKEGYGIGWGFCDNSEYIEVIGNIYENPELLKE